MRKKSRKKQTHISAQPDLTDSKNSEITVEQENRELILSFKQWIIGVLAVAMTAVIARFAYLSLKTFHHDEGVNGYFLATLLRTDVYKYDPSNYHGPSLYYFALVFSYIFGLNDFAVRLVTSLFGVATVLLIFSLRRYLGTIGTLFAALLIAVSPGLTFISRYFIHEILFLFFTFAVVVCVVKFLEGKQPGRISIGVGLVTLFVCLLPVALKCAAWFGGANSERVLIGRFLFIVTAIVVSYFALRVLLKWNDGLPLYLILAAASVMMTFATKETAFISFGTMIIALACVWFWETLLHRFKEGKILEKSVFAVLHLAIILPLIYFHRDIYSWFNNTYYANAGTKEQPLIIAAVILLPVFVTAVWIKYLWQNWNSQRIEANQADSEILTYQNFYNRFGNSTNLIIVAVLCAGVFAVVGAVFFSSFFTYPEGIKAGFEAYNIWTKTGTKDHSMHGLWGYFKWLVGAEAPILFLGALGALITFWKSNNRFAMFAALWGFGLLAAYSIIPYKTPWLAINFVLPMALSAGYGINELLNSRQKWLQYAAVGLIVFASGISIAQMIELNFYRYDDDSRPYVYAHSRRDMDLMAREIERISERTGKGKQTVITVVSPEYWPLPWTFIEYKTVLFHGSLIDSPDSEIIIGSKAQAAELEQKYGKTHKFLATYALRPGVDLMLYVRRDLKT